MATNSSKWNPNDFSNSLLSKFVPLNDPTLTPRGAKRAITLERSFDKEIWYYPRKTCEEFAGSPIEKDKAKGKWLERVRYKKQKAAKKKEIE